MKFGIISEGVTDQVVIKSILARFYENPDINVPPLQPAPRNSQGGWTRVFEYCKTNAFREFLTSDIENYVIIQVDTDVSEEQNFDIPKYRGTENELTIEELIEKVKDKLIQENIGEEFYTQYADRIIFAIAVDSIECWLLPLVCKKEIDKSEILNCLKRVNKELKINKLTDKNEKKIYENYAELALKFLEVDSSIFSKNPSLKIFIEEVDSRNINIPKEEDW